MWTDGADGRTVLQVAGEASRGLEAPTAFLMVLKQSMQGVSATS